MCVCGARLVSVSVWTIFDSRSRNDPLNLGDGLSAVSLSGNELCDLINEEYLDNCYGRRSNHALEGIAHREHITFRVSIFVSSGPLQELLMPQSPPAQVRLARKWPLASLHWTWGSGGVVQ
jgi:hypothetical protein